MGEMLVLVARRCIGEITQGLETNIIEKQTILLGWHQVDTKYGGRQCPTAAMGLIVQSVKTAKYLRPTSWRRINSASWDV